MKLQCPSLLMLGLLIVYPSLINAAQLQTGTESEHADGTHSEIEEQMPAPALPPLPPTPKKIVYPPLPMPPKPASSASLPLPPTPASEKIVYPPLPELPKPKSSASLPLPPTPKIAKKEKIDFKKIRAEFEKFQKNVDKDMVGLPTAFATNAMVIILDDSEKDTLHTIGYRLIIALIQKAAPILVSSSLLISHLIQRYKLPLEEKSDTGPCTSFLKELKTDPINTGKATRKFEEIENSLLKAKDDIAHKKFLLCAAEPEFNPDDWIIRKPNQFLHLLIPKDYRPAGVSDYKPSPTQLRPAQPLTEAELKLGLKIDHMEIISAEQMRPEVLINDAIFKIKLPQYANYFMDALINNAIFVTKTDYARSKLIKKGNIIIPTWALILHGHGLINDSIANLSLSQYKDFLNYIDIKLITKLLCVQSCYAAGKNEETIFQDFSKPFKSRTYSFAIVSGALTDSPTTLVYLYFSGVNDKTKSVRFSIFYDLAAFVKSLRSSDTINFAETVNNIMPEANKEPESYVFYANVPKIRLPGQPWFSLLDAGRHFGLIGGVLAKTREQPLDVQKFFNNSRLTGILLYARAIPFELIIDVQVQFAIIPMLPSSNFTIKKISSQYLTLNDLFYSFARTKQNLNPQKFYIGAMEGRDDILPKHSKELKTIYNILIDRSIDENREPIYTIYFTYNDKVYTDSFTDQNVQFQEALDISEIAGESAKQYEKEKFNIKFLIKWATPAEHTDRYFARIEKIKKVLKEQTKENLAMYKSYLDLSNDLKLAQWLAPYVKDAKNKKLSFDQLVKIITKYRDALIKNQEELQKIRPKKNLDPSKLHKLEMARKFNEYATLKRWYDALSSDEKKKLDEEVKKEAK